ncbi:papain family cysteine protease, partial [Ostertagia ostertagi]
MFENVRASRSFLCALFVYYAEQPTEAGNCLLPQTQQIPLKHKCARAADLDRILRKIKNSSSFDARVQWANCSSVFHIRDQANCGSCWAVSSASAMSDRVCIATQGAKQVLISDQDIVSCCTWCGYGCQGGWSIRAWYYFAEQGVVTGGNYNTKGSCRPYEIHPCGYHKDEPYYGECDDLADTPRCKRRCQLGYPKSYPSDKHYG